MLKKILALLGVFFALTLPAHAENRVPYYYGEQLPAQNLDRQERWERLGLGQLLEDLLPAGGGYSNLTVTSSASTSGGTNLTVGPTSTNTQGSLYQIGADDTAVFGGPGVSALSADPTLIMLQGIIASPLAAISVQGPGSGFSQDFLIECQVVTQGTNPQSLTILSPLGAKSSETLNGDVVDTIVCQAKGGSTVTSGSPPLPVADSGYIGIAYAQFANTSSITPTSIVALPPIGINVYPSQLNPTSAAQATFGGTVGYTVAPLVSNQVSFSVLSPSSLTSDSFENFVGSTKIVWTNASGLDATAIIVGNSVINPTGITSGGNLVTVSGVLGSPASIIQICPNNVTTNCPVQVSSSGSVSVGGSTLSAAGILSAGNVQSTNGIYLSAVGSNLVLGAGASTTGAPYVSSTDETIHASYGTTSTDGIVSPTYNSSNSIPSESEHEVFDTFTCTTNGSGVCSGTVTLSGASAFSGQTFWCDGNLVGQSTLLGTAVGNFSPMTGSTFAYNFRGLANSTSYAVNYHCDGH